MSKLSKRVLKEVIDARIGVDALELAMLLKQKGELSEFVLAKELKEDINSIRNKIYRLQHLSLVAYTKKKDEVKGWYVYFWSLLPERFNSLYKGILDERLADVKKRMKVKGEGRGYECPNKCLTLSNENALNANFACPNCGSVLVEADNTKSIEKLKKLELRIKKAIDKCA